MGRQRNDEVGELVEFAIEVIGNVWMVDKARPGS